MYYEFRSISVRARISDQTAERPQTEDAGGEKVVIRHHRRRRRRRKIARELFDIREILQDVTQ